MLVKIREMLYENMVPIEVSLPYSQGQLISLFHEAGQIDRIEHGRGDVVIKGRLPGRLQARYAAWLSSNNTAQVGDNSESLSKISE